MQDLIERQAAIDAYGDWYVEEGTADGFIGTVKQLLEGFPSAQLGTNLAQLGTDCISRQAAIDLLKQMRKDGDMIPWEGKDVFARIRKLPSAQPEIIRCRDCKHWLPHEQFGFDEDNEEYHDYCAKLIPEDEYYAFYRDADEWCSRAERREEGEQE